MLLASSKIFHRRSSPTTALPSAIPYPDVGCMISSVGTIRVAASIGVRLPVRWRSDWPLTIASSPYTGVGFSFVQAPSSAAPFIFSGFLWLSKQQQEESRNKGENVREEETGIPKWSSQSFSIVRAILRYTATGVAQM
uniref:Uncharacterized protein n=1 Tax=Oryza nivara TaxID=4536 RepID=A0A0E0IGW6_ORYNI